MSSLTGIKKILHVAKTLDDKGKGWPGWVGGGFAVGTPIYLWEKSKKDRLAKQYSAPQSSGGPGVPSKTKISSYPENVSPGQVCLEKQASLYSTHPLF